VTPRRFRHHPRVWGGAERCVGCMTRTLPNQNDGIDTSVFIEPGYASLRAPCAGRKIGFLMVTVHLDAIAILLFALR
jgi:hypothetical protein